MCRGILGDALLENSYFVPLSIIITFSLGYKISWFVFSCSNLLFLRSGGGIVSWLIGNCITNRETNQVTN